MRGPLISVSLRTGSSLPRFEASTNVLLSSDGMQPSRSLVLLFSLFSSICDVGVKTTHDSPHFTVQVPRHQCHPCSLTSLIIRHYQQATTIGNQQMTAMFNALESTVKYTVGYQPKCTTVLLYIKRRPTVCYVTMSQYIMQALQHACDAQSTALI